MKPVMFSSVFSRRRVPADCSSTVVPDTFDLVLGGGGGVPIGAGEFHVYAVAASFHTLCMLHPQHVGGSSEAAMAHSHPGLEARASLFGLFDRNPPPHTQITGLSWQLGNSAGGGFGAQVLTRDRCRMHDGSRHHSALVDPAVQITSFGCNDSAGLSCCCICFFNLHSKSLSSRLTHSHRFVLWWNAGKRTPPRPRLIKLHSYLVNVIILTVFH